jgi:hypothetical protein
MLRRLVRAGSLADALAQESTYIKWRERVAATFVAARKENRQ